MDVLVLADAYPYPLQNGHALRIYHYARLLRERHNFDLACFADAPPPPELTSIFRRIEGFPLPAAREAETVWRRLRDAFTVERMLVRSPQMTSRLRVLLEERHYDLIWGAGDAVMASIPKARKIPLLGDLVDDGVLSSLREVPRANNIAMALRKLKWACLSALFERRYFGIADQCLLVSEVDARWFRRICPATPTSVIHNGVDAEYFSPMQCVHDPRNLVFEGNLAFPPNSDGILHFCRETLPLIKRAVPDVTLTIVGKNPPPQVQALACDGIEITGYVDDVRPFLERAAVFVCPLRKGAGIKNKVLQAWAMGKATVATPRSTGGLAAEDGRNIYIRNDATGFAAAVVELLNDAEMRHTMGQAARSTIVQHYTWRKKAIELEALMESLVKRRQPKEQYA